MTFLEMQTRVRRHLGQTVSANSYYTDAEVDAAINDAQGVVAAELRVNMTYHTRTAVESTGTYSIPAEALTVAYVEVDVGSTNRTVSLEMLSFEEFGRSTYHNTTHEGEPQICKVEWGATATTGNSAAVPGDIYVWPIFNSTSYTLRIYTIQRPTTLSADADVSELPLFAHMAVTYYAAMLLTLKDSDFARYNHIAPLYSREIDTHLKVRNQRERRRRPATLSLSRQQGTRYVRQTR